MKMLSIRLYFFFPVFFVLFPLEGNALPSSKKGVYFIINPHAGKKSQKNILKLIEKHLDQKKFFFKTAITKRSKEAIALAKAAAKNPLFEIIVAVGGDGTVNEVTKGLIGSKSSLAIIPTGSGNGLARHFHIPLDPKKALEIINQEHQTWIDTIKINRESYLGVAGIGFDAKVSSQFAHLKKRGLAGYIKVILNEITTYKPQKYHLLIDGKPKDVKAFLICFANSAQYGHNLLIAPQAKIDDGYLDLIILKVFPKHASPQILHALFTGQIDHSKYVSWIRCQEVILKKPIPCIHIDGEPMQFSDDVYIHILPASLKILIPVDF